MGVSNSLLRDQRKVGSAAAGPTSGRGGENLDAALILADGSAKGMPGPASDAHILPTGEWASAVWELWLPIKSLDRLVRQCSHRLNKAKNIWAVCYGPAAAFIATCRRLKWKVHSATKIVTDEGRELLLHLDSPAAVLREVKAAVTRWMWRNLEVLLPLLARAGSGAGALMTPIWNLLKSKQNDEEWNPTLRGGLRSVLANRQYPQARVKAAGWAVQDRCLLCLHDIVSGDRFGDSNVPLPEEAAAAEIVLQQRKPVEATEEQISRAPVGSLHHRDWTCKSTCIDEAVMRL